MRITEHPPLFLTPRSRDGLPPGTTFLPWLHVKAFLSLELPQWRDRRRGHRHLVRQDTPESPWRAVALDGHLMSLDLPSDEHSRREPSPLGELETIAAEAFAGRHLELHHLPGLEATSEIDESLSAFRSRAGAELKPVLQRAIDDLREEPSPTLPWRKRRHQEQQATRREELAEALGQAIGEVVTRSFPLGEAVSRCEIGWLFLPEGFELPAPRVEAGLPERLRTR